MKSLRALLICSIVLSAPALSNTSSALLECDAAASDHICSTLYRQLSKLAKKGSPEAATMLAVFYLTGEQGLPQDPEKAMKLYERAARKNAPLAQYELAKHLMVGDYIEQDRERAMKLLEAASRRGYSDAQMLFNVIRLEDPSISLDEKAALIAQIDSLELISPEHAHHFIGRFYLLEGKKQDALAYLKKASMRGHEEAQALMEAHFEGALFRTPDAERDGFERIEVTATQIDINDAAREVIRFAKASSMFNGKSTGSRIPGQSCVFDGTCNVLHSRRDIELMNNILSGIRR